jgi:hypothetical protein
LPFSSTSRGAKLLQLLGDGAKQIESRAESSTVQTEEDEALRFFAWKRLSIKVVLLHVLLNDDDEEEEEEEEEGQRVNIVLLGMQLTRCKCGCCKSCRNAGNSYTPKNQRNCSFSSFHC